MTSTTTGAPTREPAIFEIKSANLPLVAFVLKSTDVDEVAREFDQRFSRTPDFFDHEPLVIDVTQLPPGGEGIDLIRLLMVLRQHRLSPVALRGGSPGLMTMARAAGLAPVPNVSLGRSSPIGEPIAGSVRTASQSMQTGALADRSAAQPSPVAASHDGSTQPASHPSSSRSSPSRSRGTPSGTAAAHGAVNGIHGGGAGADDATVDPRDAAPGSTALVIDKPVRSGQRIYARDSDLVITAVVNSGAEVAADGNIHVYAPLRGRALAGARGNTEARILTLCMEPELIAIAGIYRTSEKPLPADVIGQPTEVRLEGEKLLIKPLRT